MAYCNNCGKSVDDNVKFCSNCGSPINDEEDRSKRLQEYAGKIIKCPACGTEIPSFTAICPGCGHEINSVSVSSAFKDFTIQISKCDAEIVNSPDEQRTGWKSWGIGKKIGWVILNIYTFFIPLVIYLLLPLFGVSGKSSLTPEEKKKESLIKNYAFPNERECILEGLLYIKGQIDSLASGKIDRNTALWVKIWKNKASQLFEKSEMMFKGDKIANGAYSDILKREKQVQKSFLIHAIITVAIVTLCVVVVILRREGMSIKKKNTTFEWPASEITLYLPEPPTNKGEINDYNEEEIRVEVWDISKEQYYDYITACKEKGFVIECESSSTTYTAYNDDGYELDLTHYEYSAEMIIEVKAPEPMTEIKWPESDIAKRLPMPKSTFGRIEWEADSGFCIYLGNTSKEEFSEYANECYNKGFTVNYQKSDTSFGADDKDGYHIYIRYEGNNIMFIRIDDPE